MVFVALRGGTGLWRRCLPSAALLYTERCRTMRLLLRFTVSTCCSPFLPSARCACLLPCHYYQAGLRLERDALLRTYCYADILFPSARS